VIMSSGPAMPSKLAKRVRERDIASIEVYY
jgi:hypothetical protein